MVVYANAGIVLSRVDLTKLSPERQAILRRHNSLAVKDMPPHSAQLLVCR